MLSDTTKVEDRAGELSARLGEVEAELAASREALDSAERRHAIDMALVSEGASDLETARLLTELAVERMGESDVAAAVRDLRERKPFLFGGAGGSSGGVGLGGGAAMSASRGAGPSRDTSLERAAGAASGGDRAALLRYLRARRRG